MWQLNIKSIKTLRTNSENFNFRIDQPSENAFINGATLTMSGWIFDKEYPVKNIKLKYRGEETLFDLEINRPDVAQSFGITNLPTQLGFKIECPINLNGKNHTVLLTACTESFERNFAEISIEVLSPQSFKTDAKIKPIIVTSLGRTGTTLCLSTLSKHPKITTVPLYPYEVNFAQSIFQHAIDGFQVANTNGLKSDQFNEFFNESYPKELMKNAVQTVDSFYSITDDSNQQSSPEYFIEKFTPFQTQPWFKAAYEDSKEIFLVRDFRDVICSIMSFNKKRGYKAFSRENFESDEDFIKNFNGPKALLKAWEESKSDSLLVKYEDFILDTKSTLTTIFDYLNLDYTDSFLNELSNSVNNPTNVLENHMTSKSPKNSIRKWEKDLPDHLLNVANESFEDVLSSLGYD